jgi:glutathione peroxidase-family protein
MPFWSSKSDEPMAASAHEFNAVMNNGESQSLSVYAGHPLIVVNVASQWGVTDREYNQLQQLLDQFSSKGLKILAFPCNQFGKQEPGTDAEIAEFVKKFNFQGDLTQKVDVNGKNAHPLWAWMKKQKAGSGTLTNDIKWNFTKFLIDQEGKVVTREATTTPSIKLAPAIEKLLK